MDKPDYVLWSRKYDKSYGWQAQRERELGVRFRKLKAFTVADLVQISEWKFKDEPEKKEHLVEIVKRNGEEKVSRVSGQVFSLPQGDENFKICCLTSLEGVSPVIASVILTFFDPHMYGIFDLSVWKALLGNPPPNLYTPQNYIKFLAALRKTAAKHNLDARVIDKALYKKSKDESG